MANISRPEEHRIADAAYYPTARIRRKIRAPGRTAIFNLRKFIGGALLYFQLVAEEIARRVSIFAATFGGVRPFLPHWRYCAESSDDGIPAP